ncbi:MAG: U32 family peptidase [Oscillospiraceae bacterium]|nr:U32 family peptidase [Oscillospiraceae bacterium]
MPELLSPAGNFEKMKAAIRYGADAVYLAGHLFGMRSAADNFSDEELCEAVKYAHEHNVKVYLTVNTMPHGYEYPRLREFLNTIKDYGIDAIIAADLGVIATIKQILPKMEIHISTQASIVSPESALAYASLGAKRLVLARELDLSEIKAIKKALPEGIELEAFVHGSMCVSYSGRCMLSNHMIGRDANRGACAQPCRWNYKIVEEKRPDMPIPIEENELGTFIMSSKDMCTIGIIPELIEAGIDSFKIEGRMKSAYYTAVVTNAYRMAIDKYTADPDNYSLNEELYVELDSVSHREYCTGYYLDPVSQQAQLASNVGYIREKSYFATAIEYDESDIPKSLEFENANGRLALFMQKNKVKRGDAAEIISPGFIGRTVDVDELYDEKGLPIESAPHPFMKFWIRVPFDVREGDIMRSSDRC